MGKRMERWWVSIVRFGLYLGLVAVAQLVGADPVSDSHVSARFVTAADDAGRVAGVELTMAPGWHVYWRHPGEAGLATEVELERPARLELGALEWPLPVRFDSPGGITSYGYSGRVVLAAPVSASASAAAARVTVDVAWLACHDVCVLGEAQVAGGLGEDTPGFDLAAWRASLPTRHSPPPFGLRVTGGLEPGERHASLVVWLSLAADAKPQQVELFPAPEADLKVEDVRAARRGGLVRFDLVATRLTDDGRSPRLPAVVAVTTNGTRRGYELAIPLGHDIDSKGE